VRTQHPLRIHYASSCLLLYYPACSAPCNTNSAYHWARRALSMPA
jgi:hypothetical protein